MKRISAALLSGLAVATLASAPASGANAKDRLDVYTGVVTRDGLGAIVDLGVDRRELKLAPARGGARKGQVRVEAILSGGQAKRLRREGVVVKPKKVGGRTVAQRATAEAADGFEVFRRYGGPGGLKAEFARAAARHPRITKLVTIGRTVNGQEIVALKVSKHAAKRRDGSKPAVLYAGAQHAREWITPEMIRRLMHHVVDGYDRKKSIRKLLAKTELWFVPVANPDGYDYTFEPGQRLWRKNLRDNNGDGQITPGDGVDLNRNYPTKWGYDNEGSSPNQPQPDLPRPRARVRARDARARRVRRPRRLRVLRQLPLRGRAAALRHRLAGGDPDARRRDLRGDGGRRREPGRPRL